MGNASLLGGTYEFRALAGNDVHELGEHNDADIVALTVPKLKRATPSPNRIRSLHLSMVDSRTPQLTWETPGSVLQYIYAYQVIRHERDAASGAWTQSGGGLVRGAHNTSYQDRQAEAGRTYRYRVSYHVAYQHGGIDLPERDSHAVYASPW